MNIKMIRRILTSAVLFFALLDASECASMKFQLTKIDTCYLSQLTKTEIEKINDWHEVKCARECFLREKCVWFSYNSNKSNCNLFEQNSGSLTCVSKTGQTMKLYKNEKLNDNDNLKKTGLFFEKDSKNITWIIVQRRKDDKVTFNRTWSEYKNGFGHPDTGYWIGNEKLHNLTTSHKMKLRFDLWNKNDMHLYADYSIFKVLGEEDKYQLVISGYSGNAGDSMKYHKNAKFSTFDQDNDFETGRFCSKLYGRGGWWFTRCYEANLNGIYFPPGTVDYKAIIWTKWLVKTALKKTEMRITFN